MYVARYENTYVLKNAVFIATDLVAVKTTMQLLPPIMHEQNN